MRHMQMAEIFEICLQRVKAGRTIDEAVADYPAQAEELRALLQITLNALPTAGEIGYPSRAQSDSKKQFLAQAEQLQRRSGAAWLWSLLHFFRANAGQIAFGLGALVLLFVALGSAGALPGDGLYPIKLAAEQAEVNLAGSPASRITLESTYDSRRAEEVAQMIQMKRTGQVNFGGFLSKTDQNELRVAGIALVTDPALIQQTQGLLDVYVEVSGSLGLDGRVSVEKLEPILKALSGTIQQMETGTWTVDGKLVKVTAASRISGTPVLGSQVTLQTAILKDSQPVLVISGEVTSNPTATPSPSKTPQPTITLTVTPTVTQTLAPTVITSTTENTAGDDDDSKGTQEPEHEDDPEETKEPEDDDHSEDDNSGKGGEEGGDDSGSGG